MFKTIRTSIRPNIQVPFFWETDPLSEEFKKYYHSTYVLSGKAIQSIRAISEDKLTFIATTEWSSKEDYLIFLKDEACYEAIIIPQQIYEYEHGIISSTETIPPIMSYTPVKHPHANLVIPDTWDDVQSFANWWMETGMPIIIPAFPEVYRSDDATSMCLFRKNRFQVEIYLIHPHPIIPTHEHPGVEVIKMRLGNSVTPIMSAPIKEGDPHGAGIRYEAEKLGFPLMTFQHWLTRDPTTIASMWKGQTVGPMHEALIRRYHPSAHIENGYADTSLTT